MIGDTEGFGGSDFPSGFESGWERQIREDAEAKAKQDKEAASPIQTTWFAAPPPPSASVGGRRFHKIGPPSALDLKIETFERCPIITPENIRADRAARGEEEAAEEAPNVSHSSEGNEHYTNVDVMKRVHFTFGRRPALDPASCRKANEIVQADRIYTIEDNGYLRSLVCEGDLFSNPPGGYCDSLGRLVIRKQGKRRPCTETGACGLPAPHTHEDTGAAAVRWYRKVVLAWLNNDFDSAIFCAFTLQLFQVAIKAMRDEQGRGMSPSRFPHCFPASRLAYDHIEGGERVKGASPPHASALIYLPSRNAAGLARFSEAFGGDFGDVVIDPRYHGIRRERGLFTDAWSPRPPLNAGLPCYGSIELSPGPNALPMGPA